MTLDTNDLLKLAWEAGLVGPNSEWRYPIKDSVERFAALIEAPLKARIAELEQRNRAILHDYHNGTPCEQIAWAQERDDLKAERDALRAKLAKYQKQPIVAYAEISNGCIESFCDSGVAEYRRYSVALIAAPQDHPAQKVVI